MAGTQRNATYPGANAGAAGLNRRTGRRIRGFTLIETLLTLSMFTLLMSALLTGLFTGTRAWRRADAHLTRASQAEQALALFEQDLSHLLFEPEREDPVLETGLDEQKRSVLTVWSLECGPAGAPDGAVCKAQWRVEESDEGTLEWIRETQRQIGDHPVGELKKQAVLSGIKAVEFRFFDGNAWLEEWTDARNLPALIEARASLRGAPAIERWVAVRPLGGSLK